MENQSVSHYRYNALGITLCRYIRALERGDADLLQTILQRAEQDEVLERLITEIHQAYRTAEDEATLAAGVALIRSLLQGYRSLY